VNSNVAHLFGNWHDVTGCLDVLVIDARKKETMITLPSGRTAMATLGFLDGVPLDVVFGGDLGGKWMVRARGINRAEKRANEKKLRDAVKHFKTLNGIT